MLSGSEKSRLSQLCGRAIVHHAGHAVDLLGAVVEDASLDDAQEVEQRQRVHVPVADRAHAVGRDIAGGEHTVERAVLVDDGHGGDVLVAHDVPGAVHRDAGVERRRRVKVQIAHLRADVADRDRLLKAEAIEQTLRLIADVAEMCGHVIPVAERVAQCGIGNGGRDGVRVRIPVAGDVDSVHVLCNSFGVVVRQTIPYYNLTPCLVNRCSEKCKNCPVCWQPLVVV